MEQVKAAFQPENVLRMGGIILGSIVAVFLLPYLLSLVIDESYDWLLQLTLRGILTGSVYALVALGIVIINKASGVFNFAHGMMMLFGGLMFWQAFDAVPSQGFSIVIGVLATIIIMILVGDNLREEGTEIEEKPQTSFVDNLMKTITSRAFLMSGGIGIVGGIIVYFLLQNIEESLFRGAISSLVGGIALGLFVERFTIRPLIGQPILASIMMTLAVALLVQGAVALFWGKGERALPIFVEPAQVTETCVAVGVDQDGNAIQNCFPQEIPAQILPNYKWDAFGLVETEMQFQRNLVWGFGIAIVSFIAFVTFFQFSSTGLAMRAVAENQVLAESVGLRVRTILAVAWAIATTMAVVAAVIQGSGPSVGLSVLVIPPLAFRAFPAVLLGGLESITGALVGGLIIGIVEQLTTGLWDSSAGQEFAPFAVLLIVLLIRPDGLFGQKRIDRV